MNTCDLPTFPTQTPRGNSTQQQSETALSLQLWKNAETKGPVKMRVLGEGSREEMALEVSPARGAEPAEAVETGRVSPGWGQTAGKPLFK